MLIRSMLIRSMISSDKDFVLSMIQSNDDSIWLMFPSDLTNSSVWLVNTIGSILLIPSSNLIWSMISFNQCFHLINDSSGMMLSWCSSSVRTIRMLPMTAQVRMRQSISSYQFHLVDNQSIFPNDPFIDLIWPMIPSDDDSILSMLQSNWWYLNIAIYRFSSNQFHQSTTHLARSLADHVSVS